MEVEKMSYSVIKSSGFVLVHTPDMVIHNGTTQTMERVSNPDSEYLKKVPKHLRSFEEVVNYGPNQTYIGNLRPEALDQLEKPWYANNIEGSSAQGKYGEILPQDEFIAMVMM